MPQIIPAGQLNPASLGADDVYISIVNPPSYIVGVPTDVFAVVGGASYGPVNIPVHLGSGQDASQNFGPISAASLSDPHDLATDLYIAFGQASSLASIEGWAIRVTDGTDVKAHATLTLSGGGSLTLTARYSGVLGNQIKMSFTAGSLANTTTVTVQGFSGIIELYPNLPNTGFITALNNALTLGLSSYRGPSNWIVASAPTAGNISTLPSTVTLTSGTDGRSGLTTSTLLGSNSSLPPTGIWALQGTKPAVGVAWIAGLTDSTAVSTLVAFATTLGTSVLFALPAGTSTATAISTIQTNGVNDPSITYVKDWIYFFDSINNQVRLVAPSAFIGGRIATLAPQESPGNKTVNFVNGTERTSIYTGNQPYTPSEVAQLEQVGVGCQFITNPIPAGSEFGIRHGLTSSGDPVTQPFEYWRMTMYLARSFAGAMGQYVDQLQSQQPDDNLRAQVRLSLNNFLTLLQGLGQIDGFLVTCKLSTSPSAQPGNGINTPQSIAQHYLFVLVQVTYLASVRFFILALQGGTTVVTIGGSQYGQQLAGS